MACHPENDVQGSGDLLQALSNSGEQSYMKGMKTLEINPRHPLIAELKRQVSYACTSIRGGPESSLQVNRTHVLPRRPYKGAARFVQPYLTSVQCLLSLRSEQCVSFTPCFPGYDLGAGRADLLYQATFTTRMMRDCNRELGVEP